MTLDPKKTQEVDIPNGVAVVDGCSRMVVMLVPELRSSRNSRNSGTNTTLLPLRPLPLPSRYRPLSPQRAVILSTP